MPWDVELLVEDIKLLIEDVELLVEDVELRVVKMLADTMSVG